MTKPADINDQGDSGSLQRLVYCAARACTPAQWESLHDQAQAALGQGGPDTELSLMVNALACACERVQYLQARILEAQAALASAMS